jgi:hypothetical protein
MLKNLSENNIYEILYNCAEKINCLVNKYDCSSWVSVELFKLVKMIIDFIKEQPPSGGLYGLRERVNLMIVYAGAGQRFN